MLRTALVIVALGASAHADHAAWVGSWSGKVTAKGCTDDGKRSVTLDVALTSDGGLRSNGDVLEDGFGDLDWTVDGANLADTREGMKATLTHSKKGAKLALTTDGGCKVTGTLTRATSGIADCDRLLALATVESECASMSSDTRGAKLDTARASWQVWQKLRGKKRAAQAKQCKDDADTIAGEVESCSIGSFASTGIAECDDYLRGMQKLQLCTRLPDASKQAMVEGSAALSESIGAWKQSGSPAASLDSIRDACKSGADAIAQVAQAAGC